MEIHCDSSKFDHGINQLLTKLLKQINPFPPSRAGQFCSGQSQQFQLCSLGSSGQQIRMSFTGAVQKVKMAAKTVWDVDHEDPADRIQQRRERIQS